MVAFNSQTSPSAYVVGRRLGEGTFGTVCLATSKLDGSVVALKFFRESAYQAEISLEIALCEMLMVAEPASQHIVKLFDVFSGLREHSAGFGIRWSYDEGCH